MREDRQASGPGHLPRPVADLAHRVCLDCGREWATRPAGFIDRNPALNQRWGAGSCAECLAGRETEG